MGDVLNYARRLSGVRRCMSEKEHVKVIRLKTWNG